ncbi:MAG: hypothetical protein IKN04_09135 [Clostridia bacterium]|nr:hypothetical protein [Clostridia bacterium]
MKKIIMVILILSILLLYVMPTQAEQGGLAYQLKKMQEAKGEAEKESQEETDVICEMVEIDPWKNVSEWENSHGYTFPVYGKTSVDLSPISDYLSILEDKGIYISLLEMLITNNRKDYAGREHDYISAKIGESFYLTYLYYLDDSKFSLSLEVPCIYRPIDEALQLLLVSTLSIDEEEAGKLYKRLQYNVIDEWCVIETDQYTITYSEPRLNNGNLAGFVILSVEKFLK